MRISSPGVLASVSPSAYVVPTTGMSPVYPLTCVTAGIPLRAGSAVLPWLKKITPAAPAASAFSAFSSNVHTPRWIRAMSPAGNPAKSDDSQPLVEVLPIPNWMSTGVTAAVTSPGSVWGDGAKSVPSM
jgi:hypothetical protein